MFSVALTLCDMKKTDKSISMERLYRALADRTRLRLLNLMGDDEVCVCFFVEVLKMSQPRISRHLAYLKQSGIVATRREGKWMHYRVVVPADPFAAQALADARAWLSTDKEMQRDRDRLEKVCCSPAPPPHVKGAPRPASVRPLTC
jgi:ArsR family transcriptional regulator